MRHGRLSLKVVSGLLIALGLLISVTAAASALLDAQPTASPFDQVNDMGGSGEDFVPLIAPKNIGADGYPTPAALGADRGSDYAQRSEVDQLRTLYTQSRSTWACADPNSVFRDIK